MRWLLRRIAGRCDTHDRAWPLLIARLEDDLGITGDPMGIQAGLSFADAFANPSIIDCGRRRCQERGQER